MNEIEIYRYHSTEMIPLQIVQLLLLLYMKKVDFNRIK